MAAFITDGMPDQTDNGSSMPGGGNKAEIGRTERAATRRNKIFNSQMRINIREIDRTMKIALRQIDLTRQDLFTEMDSLEARSGWLKDTERNAIAAAYLNPNRRVSLIKTASSPVPQTGRSGTYGGNSSRRNDAEVARQSVRKVNSDRGERDAAYASSIIGSKTPETPELHSNQRTSFLEPAASPLVRSHTDILLPASLSPDPPSNLSGIRKVGDRAASSLSGARAGRKMAASVSNNQVRFQAEELLETESPDPDVFDDESPQSPPYQEEQGLAPSPTHSILSISRQSPGQRLLSSETLTSSGRRKSLLFIPKTDERYTLLDIPLKHLDVRKIKEHARSSQKLRFEGRHILVKNNARAGETAGSGAVDSTGEYIPKRIKAMREERLNKRRASQDLYNQNLMESAIAKFKELYVVPTNNGGLDGTVDYFSALK